MTIAFMGYKKQERHSVGTQSDEDKMLFGFIAAKGIDIRREIWNDPNIEWKKYAKAIVKSPWDYHEHYHAFEAWLKMINGLGIELINPFGIISWNIDKHYLQDIADAGLPVIPTMFIERQSRPELGDFFGKFNAGSLVIKPCISASARNTMVVSQQNIAERDEQLQHYLKEESYLVQPFVREISGGELSFIFLGGQYSHCVLKLPKKDDFRVQHFHGGTIRKFDPSPVLISSASDYVRQFAPGCLYARVDGLVVDNGFKLMELELIEPYLFLDTEPLAYQRYYDALVKML